MYREKLRRAVSLLLVFCMVLQTVLINVSFVVHAETGGGTFVIQDAKLYDADNQKIPEGGAVDASDTLTVRYTFKITNYGVPGEEILFKLPRELVVCDSIHFKLVDADTNLKFAEISVDKTGSDGISEGTIRLLDDSKLLSDLEGWFQIKTTWNYEEVADGGDRELEFDIRGGITVKVPVHVNPVRAEADVDLKKKGSKLDDGDILWKITVTPSSDPAGFPVKHVRVTDMIPLDQDFVQGSWKIDKAEPDGTRSLTGIAAYGFLDPSGTTYGDRAEPATPSTYSSRTRSGAVPLAEAKQKELEAEPAGIAETGEESIWDEKKDFLFHVPEDEEEDGGYIDRGASSSDASPSGARYSRRSRKPEIKTIRLPGFRTADGASQLESGFQFLAPSVDEGTGKETDHGTLVYEFPFGIQDSYIITFRTRMNEEGMKAAGTVTGSDAPGHPDGDPARYRFKNSAAVTWPKDAVSDPLDPGVDITLVRSRDAEDTIEYDITYLVKNGEVMDGISGIKWTVQVNPGGLELADGTYLTDEFQHPEYVLLARDGDGRDRVYFQPEGGSQIQLSRCPGSDGVSSACAGFDPSNGRCSDSSHFTYVDDTLQYVVGGGKIQGRFWYFTRLDPTAYANARYPAIMNTAGLGYGDGYYGYGVAEPVWPVRDWITKTGIYDRSKHQITWTVEINRKNQDLVNAIFTDELNLEENQPDAQKYVDGSFYVDGIPVAPSTDMASMGFTIGEEPGAKQTLSYKFGNIRERHTISFSTVVLDKNHYQTNQNDEKCHNTAILQAVYENEQLEQSATAEVRIPSEVIKKQAGEEYNHKDNLLTWTITINGNRMPISNAVVTDVLEAGQAVHMNGGTPDVLVKKLDAAGAESEPVPLSYTVAKSTDNSGSAPIDTVTVTFHGGISDTYRITVRTQLTDAKKEEWFKKQNTELEVHNTASIAGNGLDSVNSNECTQTLDHSIVKKEAIYEDGDDFITWRVLINQHGMPIPLDETGGTVTSVYLEDTVNVHLQLDLGSVKLYKGVTIGKDGSYDLSAVGVEVYDADETTPANHRLTYGGAADGFTENIYYEVMAESEAGSGVFRFSFTGNTKDGNPITTIDAANRTIFGSETYVLEFVTNITDNNSTVDNTVKLAGTAHTSSVTGMRVGYSTGEGGGLGRRAAIDIQKVDRYDHSIKLPDAKLALYDKSDRAGALGILDTPVIAVTGSDGKALFNMLYFNNRYQLQETKAPAGYKQPQSGQPWYIDMTPSRGGTTVNPGPAASGDSSDHTFSLRKADLTADGVMKLTVENTPKFGWISIKKVGSEDGIPLQGVKFTVYNKSGRSAARMYTDLSADDGAPVLAEVTTGADGIAYIDGLRCGDYYLKETRKPDHYAQNPTEYEFTIPSDIDENYDPGADYSDGTRTRPEGARGTFAGSTAGLPYLITNTPVGDFEVLKRDARDHSKAVNGAEIGLFRVRACQAADRIQKQTTASGKVTFKDLSAGTYYVKEIKAPSGYRLNETVLEVKLEIQPSGNAESVVRTLPAGDAVLYDEPVGSIVVTKVSSGTGRPLRGAEFTLYTDKFCTVEAGSAQGLTSPNPAVTDDDGKATFAGLSLGTYYYKETKRPAGHIISDGTAKEVRLTQAGQGVEKTCTDAPILASVQVRKLDSVTGQGVAGAVILLTREDGSDIGTAVTDGDGCVVFKNLEIGVYYAVEQEAPEGYLKNETAKIKLEIIDDAAVSGTMITRDTSGRDAEIKNDPVGAFLFQKADAVTGAPLAGAVIELRPTAPGTGAAAASVMTTGGDGTCLFESLPYGEYRWEEIEAPAGYLLPDVPPSGTITIDRNTAPVELYRPLANRPLPIFRFQIKKTGEPDGRLLDGAVYEVRQKDKPDQVIARAVTVNGIADFGILSKGIKYYYEEVTAPKGYKLDTEKHEFMISDDGTDAVRTEIRSVQDLLERGSFTLKKADSSQEANPIRGAVFRLSYLDEGAFGTRNPSPDQTSWERTSDEAGEVVFEGLPLGRYRIEELSAPAQYHVDRDWNYEFELTADGERAVYKSMDELGRPVDSLVNYGVYKGDLVITKTDGGQPSADGISVLYKPLAGAKIGVFLQSGGQLVREEVTDDDGKVTFADLWEGDYYYQELEAPSGYALDPARYSFTVGKEDGEPEGTPMDGVVLERVMRNELITGDATVTKVDASGVRLLAGAEISLYTGAGERLASKVTDGQGNAVFEDLLYGEYYLQETKAPDGYVLDETRYPFTITLMDEKVETQIKNDRIYDAALTVEKVDASSGRRLAGAGIALYTEAGEKIGDAVTDDAGIAVFTGLLKGKYYIQEVSAPSGYVLDETQHPFEVTDPDEAVRIQLKNKKAYSGSTGGGGGSTNPKPGTAQPPSETKPGEIGPGILPTEPPAQETLPSDEALQPSESAAQPPAVTDHPDGTVTIVPPNVPGGTVVIITKPDGTEVYRGVTSDNGSVSAQLPPGDYTLIAIDDEGVPLANMPFTIGDLPVPLAAPAAGDESVPMALLMTILLGALTGSAVLIWNRKKYMDGLRESGIIHEKRKRR